MSCGSPNEIRGRECTSNAIDNAFLPPLRFRAQFIRHSYLGQLDAVEHYDARLPVDIRQSSHEPIPAAYLLLRKKQADFRRDGIEAATNEKGREFGDPTCG
jgi:hypothetical protein